MPRRKKRTITQLIELLGETWAHEKSPDYWRGMKHALRLLANQVDDNIGISLIEADLFKSYLLQSGRAPNTINDILNKIILTGETLHCRELSATMRLIINFPRIRHSIFYRGCAPYYDPAPMG